MHSFWQVQSPAEDIEAHNYSATSTLDKTSGNVAFSVPMQGFEFDKRLMQRHFNQDSFLDTQQFPTARLVGKITNLEDVDFSQDGSYEAIIEGELTIKGVTNRIREKGNVTVNGAQVTAESVFNVTLVADGRLDPVRVYTLLNNRQVIVERIFVQFDGGSFLSPIISEVILYGRDAESGVLLAENIRP